MRLGFRFVASDRAGRPWKLAVSIESSSKRLFAAPKVETITTKRRKPVAPSAIDGVVS